MLSTPPSKKEAQHLIYNMFKNPGFETNLQGVCKGLSDATATTTPIGIVGTTPIYPNGCLAPDQQHLVETLISRDTVAPLTGNASLKISKPASDRQNDIIYLDEIKLDESRKGRPLEFSFNYKYSEDFEINNGLSDLRVYILEYDDVDVDSRVITLPISDVDGSGKFQASFTTTKNYVRPFLYVATTNANAYDFWVDDLLLTDLQAQFIPFMSDMEDVTVTGSWTTNTTYIAKRAVQGQFAYYDVTVKTTGTPTSASLTLNIPDTIDFVNVNNGSAGPTSLVSLGYATDLATAGYPLVAVVVNNEQQIYVQLYSASGSYAVYNQVNRTVPFTFANGDSVNVKFKVPIVGWTSGVKSQAQMLQNLPVAFSVYKNGGSVGTDSVITSYTAKNYDLTGGFNLSAGTFTVPRSGVYTSVLTTLQSAATTGTFQLKINGTNYPQRFAIDASAFRKSGAIQVYLNAGDVVSINSTAAFTPQSTDDGVVWTMSLESNANTLLAINRSTTKYLASNLTSNTTDIASLRMTNLIVGKRYRVVLSPSCQASGGADLLAIHDSNTVARYRYGATSVFSSIKSPIFTATTTSLTFNFSVASGTATLYGNGTLTQTYVTLTELNNTVEGNF